MSTKDRAREKLLNSMRKTKAVINDQPDVKQAHAETYAAPPAKTAEPEVSNPQRTSRNEVMPRPRAVLSSDPYQSRGRIWPD